MASCQTYSSSSHFRHPWFDISVAKRKHPSPRLPNDMDDDDEEEQERVTPPTKRRRCTGLENGFSQMRLGSPTMVHRSQQGGLSSTVDHHVHGSHQYGEPGWDHHTLDVQEVQGSSAYHPPSYPSSSSTPTFPSSSASPTTTTTAFPSAHPTLGRGDDVDVRSSMAQYMGGPVVHAVQPGSVEEPGIAPEVKMKSETWYEPEPDRVVITDLDGFIESDDDEAEHHQRDQSNNCAPGATSERSQSNTGAATTTGTPRFELHPHYLEHLQSNKAKQTQSQFSIRSHPPRLPPPSDSQALVLFRPPPSLLPTVDAEKEREESRRTQQPTYSETVDEYAMDLDN